MARFRFRLEPVLEHRRVLERQRQCEVAEIEVERRALEDRIRDCQDRLGAERRALREDLVSRGGTLDVVRIRHQAAVSGAIVGQAQRAVLQLAGVHKRLEEARGRLIEATTARKAVERLRERELEAWRLRLKRLEDRELDEIAVMHAAKEQA